MVVVLNVCILKNMSELVIPSEILLENGNHIVVQELDAERSFLDHDLF